MIDEFSIENIMKSEYSDTDEDLLSVEEMFDENGNRIKEEEEIRKQKRRRKRRRKQKPKKQTEEIKILHSNTCGYTSKQESWKEILKEEEPEVVTVNESAL